MQRDERAYLNDILEAIQELQIHTENWTINDLSSTWNRWAVMKALEIIGEAAGELSESTRREIPDIPWSAITGMRNILVHAYFKADVQDLWQTLRKDLVPLSEAVKRYLDIQQD